MILLIIIAIILIIVLQMYNKLVNIRNKVKQSESGIDVYLNQRFDLIPNLVECVKAYSKHEQSIFTEIAALRTGYMNKSKDIKSAEKLNNKMNQLVAVAENYPDLKASEQYLNLQKNLTKIESQIQAARRIYNSDVTAYNIKLETVPSNIVANLFGFKPAQLFEIEEYKKENVNIAMGLFCTPDYSDVSAVIYSSLATWGKVRALADNPSALTIYTTFTPRENSLYPKVHQAKKNDYIEHLADGLYILHNPFAKYPLPKETLSHPRVAQGYVESDGYVNFVAPEDFLLLRFLQSFNLKD